MKKTSLGKIGLVLLTTLSLVAFSYLPLQADEPGAETDASDMAEVETEEKQQRWAAFPILASSTETGFMYGGMLFHFLPVDEPGQQASTIDLMAFATTEDQYQVILTPNLFFDNNRYRLNFSLNYSSWEANYYGIGNDSSDEKEEYQSDSIGASFTIERKFYDQFVAGLIGTYASEEMTTEAGGMLQRDNIAGSSDFEYAGLGIRAGYDTRDNTNAPNSGALATFESMWFDENLGSDFDFDMQSLDLRYFVPVREDQVLAFSIQMKESHGDVPFRLLPSPDGTMLLRGIENGRYRDRTLLGLQSGYRFPVWKRFSGALFAEAAQVANDVSDIEFSSFKTSIGLGIRYALNPEQRFNIRADIAWVDGGFGAVINVREAF
ncbi:MAG: BamA/TamA family outer membrane protein [Desulfobacteraceae bacterium]|jgi:outer membrane protein assembly factor BamA